VNKDNISIEKKDTTTIRAINTIKAPNKDTSYIEFIDKIIKMLKKL
jgi:hypothetical protein